jgi:hypothetical protein
MKLGVSLPVSGAGAAVLNTSVSVVPRTRRNAMTAIGAQMLSTDYPVNEPARWQGNFVVALPEMMLPAVIPLTLL